ncbi:hypothetical protein SDC9_143532 [bioreactor metagenome]|jgi:hypothetical protein|uniref:Uncharacterized protein n=1 Tax=bioreactor metagenome TaxID=1076179 RepID=A0A645E477_9ZZZZ
MVNTPEPLTLKIFITEKEKCNFVFLCNMSKAIYNSSIFVNYKHTNKILMLQREVGIESDRH